MLQKQPNLTFNSRQFLPAGLAPMAGITNAAYRQLILELLQKDVIRRGVNQPLQPLLVDEMVAARAISGRISKARQNLQFSPLEDFRSVQLYSKEPEFAFKAAEIVAKESLADHIDLNFGCPVKKVTSSGGGSAIPAKPELLREIIKQTVAGVKSGTETSKQKIPVTAKFRLGLYSDGLFYLRTAAIAIEEGCELITLHSRTTEQFYSGQADWDAIKKLKVEANKLNPEVKVIGNGDIFSPKDAINMLEMTGVDGVSIGRGAVGRPWIFANIAAVLDGEDDFPNPNFGEICAIVYRHLDLLIHYFSQHKKDGEDSEKLAVRALRAVLGQYFKGFPISRAKVELMKAPTKEALQNIFETFDPKTPYPEAVLNQPRGRTRAAKKVYLPQNW